MKTNYHSQLKTLIAELDGGQDDEAFEASTISVFSDHIAFFWEDGEDIELDCMALAEAAARLEMKAVVSQCAGSLQVQLWPLNEGGAS